MCGWDPRLSGILRSVRWQFLTDISGQHIGPIFKGQEIQMRPIGFPWTSVRNYHRTLRNIPEEYMSRLLRGEASNHTVLWLLCLLLGLLQHSEFITWLQDPRISQRHWRGQYVSAWPRVRGCIGTYHLRFGEVLYATILMMEAVRFSETSARVYIYIYIYIYKPVRRCTPRDSNLRLFL